MRSKTSLRGSTGIITFVFAGLLALDGAWAIARSGVPAPPKDRGWDHSSLAEAPEKARAKRNPLENDPDAAAAGKKLFNRNCARCHGRSGEGGKRGPALRATEVQQAAPGTLFWILTNGVVRRGMPDWSKLPEPERWQIVSYMKSLGAAPTGQKSSPHD